MASVSALIAALIAALVPLFADAPTGAAEVLREIPILERAVPLAPPPEAVIIFGGDMMFDRYIRQKAEQFGEDHTLDCASSTLRGADLVVANLEGPITPHPSTSMGSEIGAPENFMFTFPTSTAALLARYNIRLVNLGNNHIMNFGEDGARSTMEALAEAGVGFFGSPLQSAFVSREVSGIPFEFVSYNEFGGPGREAALLQIQAARSAGRLPILYAHWGDEYEPAPERVRELARRFADAGAEIIIGSHPHIIQEHELYRPAGEAGRGTHIYYSLGNLVFDQYWNEQVRTGLLLRITFGPEGIASIDEIPIELQRDGRTCLKDA